MRVPRICRVPHICPLLADVGVQIPSSRFPERSIRTLDHRRREIDPLFMARGLVRYQRDGDRHFITFSCYQRRPNLDSGSARTIFERSLERTRVRYGFIVLAYVVMPEHVHLLVTEPRIGTLATALQALKISVARSRVERPFWQARYYDFNVFTTPKQVEKIRYIHRNPVRRGLTVRPEDWAWSSFRYYATGERGPVAIASG